MTKNKILWLLLSVVIAFAMWLYVITVVSPGSEHTVYNIQITDKGTKGVLEDRGLMVKLKEYPSVDVTFSGNRTDLVKLNAGNVDVSLDFSRFYEPYSGAMEYTVSTPGDMAEGAVIPVKKNPSSIYVEIVSLTKNHPVEVQIAYKDELPDGYVVDKETLLLAGEVLKTNEITVTGPTEDVVEIAYAQIEVEFGGRTQISKKECTVTLYDKKGNPVYNEWLSYPSTVSLEVNSRQEWTIPVDVKKIDGAGATADTCKTTPSVPYIIVTGSDSDMAKVADLLEDGVLYLGEIDLADYLEDEVKVYDLWDLLPSGVTVLSAEDGVTEVDEISVSIKFPDLLIKTITITDIRDEYAPVGKTVMVLDEEVEVRLRGPKEIVQQLESEDLYLVVDLSRARPGEQKFTARVEFKDETITGVAAIRSCEVTVLIQEAVDQQE